MESFGDSDAFARLRQWQLSTFVMDTLVRCQTLSKQNGLSGAYGTGVLLISIVELGRAATNSGFYPPRELARLIDAHDPNRRFDEACKAFWLREASGPDAERPSAASISASFYDVFERASKPRASDGILASRHLIASLLAHSDRGRQRLSNAHRLLREANIQPAGLLREFLMAAVEHVPADERTAWQAMADRADADLTYVVQPPYWPDIPTGSRQDDCLNLDRTVSAMARLIASPDLKGNLSLGIFGNWGSGKSFFMRRLRAEIESLTEQSESTGGVPSYWPNIAQVEFNAWHYADANLWASLVSHLFEELLSFRTPKPNSAEQLELALKQLSLTVQVLDEAKRDRDARLAEVDTAQALLDTTKVSLQTTANELAAAVGRSVWTTVDEELIEKRPELAEVLAKARGEAQENIQAVRAAATSVEPLYAEACALTSSAGRLRSLTLQLLRDPTGKKVLYQTAAILAFAMLGLGLAVFFLPRMNDFGASLAVLTAGVTGAVTRVSVWIRDRASVALGVLEPLTRMRAAIESELSKAQKQKDATVQRLQTELTTKSATLIAAEQALALRTAQVGEAVEQVTGFVGGKLVTRFIAERAASTDYKQKLGLTAMIRRDFEKLSELIEGHNNWLRNPKSIAAVQETLNRTLPTVQPGELEKMFEQLGINRIVIYIDDLDRCPAERVVEVLQTIHLLLAFPVFAVIVGVDARWVDHSLRSVYPHLLGSHDANGKVRSGPELVSPMDYLEKIFQIPFWIPPLDQEATRLLLHKVAPAQVEDVVGRAPQSQSDDPPAADAQGTLPLHSSAAIEHGEAPAQRGESASAPAQPAKRAVSNGDSDVERVPRRVLQMTGTEREIMIDLAAVIGRSPRAAKRFVNSYCLLKASLGRDERVALAAETTSLRAQMLLLAVITGAPKVAAEFISYTDRETTALENLKRVAERPPPSVEAKDTAGRIFRFCLAHQDTSWNAVKVTDVARWSTRVAQFAFEDFAT